MALHLSFLLIFTGLTGIHSITTVDKVSVKAGRSISIPCLYGSQYVNHVKCLCQGQYWAFCSYVVKTNQQNSKKFSISDDKNQRIFTVTINDLANKDSGYYWCAVEINGAAAVREYFHLSVTTGAPTLYVHHQYITGFTGQNITINCHCRNHGEMAWCRLGRSCVTGSSGSIDGMRVTIDVRIPDVFTVTMSDLRTESSGWYLCVKGDFQMPVHVTVNEQPTMTTGHSPTPQSTDQAPTVHDAQHRSSVDLKKFIIPLGVLIFIVMVTLLIWFVLKRHKKTKAESSATTTAEEEVTYSSVMKKGKTSGQVEEEVTYNNVKHMGETSGERSEVKSGEDVTYSSVVITSNKQQTEQRQVEAKAEDVTYSCLAQHKQNK